MSEGHDDWPLLAPAWTYALVLAGTETAATELLRDAFDKLARRTDAADPAHAVRILFSGLYRARLGKNPPPPPATPAEDKTRPFHLLAEPGRSAVTLLNLGLFEGEDLADLLGSGLDVLSEALNAARAQLATNLSA